MLQFMIYRLTAVLDDRKGISALEYGILAAAIIGAVGAAATTIGTDLPLIFAKVTAALDLAAK